MNLIPGMAISASGLTAEKLRLDIIANNLANIETTRTQEGGPYRRQMPVFEERLREEIEMGFKGYGIKVARIEQDGSAPRRVYNPDHPDAGEDGYVSMPNIDIVDEMIDMITATRAYEANVTAFNASKSMALKALEIGRG